MPQETIIKNLIFVDCEGHGPAPTLNDSVGFEFGAVAYPSRQTFHNYYFHLFLGKNPFGHSARRIGDFYAGLSGDFTNSSSWKKLRVTTHDHNPVHDAMGNLEAFEKLLNGER